VSRAWVVKGLDPDAPLALNARRVLAVRIGEFYAWDPIVDDNDHTDELHQLRISAKRLRYTLELFRDVFGEAGKISIERVREIQTVLGAFHDQDVRIALIEDELRRLAGEPSDALGSAGSESSSIRPNLTLQSRPEDARSGLIHLLERQHAAQQATLLEFRTLWERLKEENMRETLVSLSLHHFPNATAEA